MLHQDGLAISVKATIEDRMGKVKGGIFTTASLLETIELQAMGGMLAAKVLWEGAIVPSLLAGAGTWVGITCREEEMLEELQELFWRTILQVPRGTPRVMFRAETGCMSMRSRIWKMKLLLASRIVRQEGSLANKVYTEQVKMGWSGLAKEVAEIGKKIGIKDTELSMKEEVEEAVFNHNYKEMKEEICKYDKLKDIKDEDLREGQEYMKEKSLDKSRMAFRIRTKMVKKVKMNFKNSFKGNLKCEECEMEAEETQAHMMECPGWREELGDLEVLTMEGQIEFFTRVLKRKLT